MKVTSIRERLGKGEPFVLRLSDGRKIEVPHPDFIAVGEDFVVVVGRDNSTSKIDAHHIVSIEDLRKAKR